MISVLDISSRAVDSLCFLIILVIEVFEIFLIKIFTH